jgi:hypothetical protein
MSLLVAAGGRGCYLPWVCLRERKERGGVLVAGVPVTPPVSFLAWIVSTRGPSMQAVHDEGSALRVRAEPLNRLGQRYRRYRLADPPAESG